MRKHTIKQIKKNNLVWLLNGPECSYKNAQKYIKELNKKNINNHNNWRLPTLEEAIQLIKTEKISKLTKEKFGLIDIWTNTKYSGSFAYSASYAWGVDFGHGHCHYDHIHVDDVRAVRAVRAVRSKN